MQILENYFWYLSINSRICVAWISFQSLVWAQYFDDNSLIIVFLSISNGSQNSLTKASKGIPVCSITNSRVFDHLIVEVSIFQDTTLILESHLVFQNGLQTTIINKLQNHKNTIIENKFDDIDFPKIVIFKTHFGHDDTQSIQLIHSRSLTTNWDFTSIQLGQFKLHFIHQIHHLSWLIFKNENFLIIQKNAHKGHKYLHHKVFANKDIIIIKNNIIYHQNNSSNSLPKCIIAAKGSNGLKIKSLYIYENITIKISITYFK